MATARGEICLPESIYNPLLEALASDNYRPKTLFELVTLLPELGFTKLAQATAILVGNSALAPCQTQAAAQGAAKRCQILNTELCRRAQLSKQVEWLASPVLGGGVAVNRFEQLFLLVRSQGKKQPLEWAQHAWGILESQQQKIVKEGKTLESADENLAELLRMANELAEKRLPILKVLQVV